MTLTIELLPDLAANERRLVELVGERSSPLERINLLHGSALQRLSVQRMLAAEFGGGIAALYGFTPVDIAREAAQLGDAPVRRRWPAGADLATLARLLPSLPLLQLDPATPGLPQAMLRALTDLREAALSPDDLPTGESWDDIRAIYRAWTDTVAGIADRTATYEDALSDRTALADIREALGGAPLIISGIYDLTRIQRLLLARLAEAVPVRMLLVAPSDEPSAPPNRTIAALRRELGARVVPSRITPTSLAPDQYFSVGDPTSEADEIARRILQLGREGVAWHEIAILHAQGESGDDRLCAALSRAGVPSWRIAGQPVSATPIGRATLGLAELLLTSLAHDRAAVVEWLSHRALRPSPLGIVRQPSRWQTLAEPDADLQRLLDNLSQRANELADALSWGEAATQLQEAAEIYLDAEAAPEAYGAIRDQIGQLAEHDALTDGLGGGWSPTEALTALSRALNGRVLRDPARLIGGVNVGAAAGPARGIRYEAIFAAGIAERVFPAVPRQAPLLSDAQRAQINASRPDELALQGDRVHTDRHIWALMRRAARRQFTASWSRRVSAIGGPSRASSVLLESAAAGLDSPGAPAANTPRSEADLVEVGRIARLPSSTTTVTPTPQESREQDWNRPLSATDSQSLELALLGAGGVDVAGAIPLVWPASEEAQQARRRRNAAQFTEYDGLLPREQLGDDWQPLARSWTAEQIETYLTCPYRFFLRHVLGAEGEAQPERPDRHRQLVEGALLHRVLDDWITEYLRNERTRSWLDYVEDSQQLVLLAEPVLDDDSALAAIDPPAARSQTRERLLAQLERLRRREALDAREGWRPIALDVRYDATPIRAPGGRQLLWRGEIDRIDRHTDDRQRGVVYSSIGEPPDPNAFADGSSMIGVAMLAALRQRDVPVAQAEAMVRGIGPDSQLSSLTLRGEALTRRGSGQAPAAVDRLNDVLRVVADGLESGNFIANPGKPPAQRPNCADCAYTAVCTPDIGRRYQHKLSRQPEPVRALESLRSRRSQAW